MNKRLLLATILLVPALAALRPAPPADGEPAGVPVGTILAWWGLPRDLPVNFELCDGTWPDAKDAVFKWRKPDLRSHFIRGSETPQSFNPSAYIGDGQDQVNLTLPDTVKLTEKELPPHTHPMQHVHLIGDHVHLVGSDVELKVTDPNPKSHSHLLANHDHTLADHLHRMGEWVQVAPLTAGTGSDPFILVKDDSTADANTAFSGFSKLAANATSASLIKTGNVDGSLPLVGKGQGFVATKDLATGPGVKPVTHAPADTGAIDTSAPNSSDHTGPNITPGEQVPLQLGTVSFDNRPAYLDVVFIIRVK